MIKRGRPEKLLGGIGEWCIRYSPLVANDPPEGIIVNISGCAHLWGGEETYLKEIVSRLKSKGYNARAAIADTIGTAWAVSRYGKAELIVPSGAQAQALLSLPPAALRLEQEVLKRLAKLGFYQIRSFINMPRSIMRRRFGDGLLLRLGQAVGQEEEAVTPIKLIPPYQERLPCLEPVRTARAIEIGITRLLEALCQRLQQEGKGLRAAELICYRIDGKIQQVAIGTSQPSHSVSHLFSLLAIKVPSITPGLGIELFVLEASKVQDLEPVQETLWMAKAAFQDTGLSELLDRIAGRAGSSAIHRYLPQEHYWPERSLKTAASLLAKANTGWRKAKPRPTHLLAKPEQVEVAAPVPDYPPILFKYRGSVHYIKKADGPERIEREWWLDKGEHRDYYMVEDEEGRRYWLFRSGHYQRNQSHQWFIHGFFA